MAPTTTSSNNLLVGNTNFEISHAINKTFSGHSNKKYFRNSFTFDFFLLSSLLNLFLFFLSHKTALSVWLKGVRPSTSKKKKKKKRKKKRKNLGMTLNWTSK